MKKTMFTLIAGLLVSCAWASSAQAQLRYRTFVSSTGSNSNTCEQSAPCRTFSGAFNKTEVGGEITALDSGEYGAITINKSLTIQGAPGVQATMGLQTSGGLAGNGVINVGLEAEEVVVLRNLYISKAAGAQQTGIRYFSGGTLHVENCVVTGFTNGIKVTSGKLFVKDTLVRDNVFGIWLDGGLSSIDNCRIENSLEGVHITASAQLTLRNCLIPGNGFSSNSRGIRAEGGSVTRIENCVINNHSTAIDAFTTGESSPYIYISHTMIFGNQFGLYGERFFSFGNNRISNSFDSPLTATIALR